MKAYLSLGSNLGERSYYLGAAISGLGGCKRIKICQESSVYETEPWGLVQQPLYWNMVLEIETDLDPVELLHICQNIENNLGRKRIFRWGPRTVDIDVLLYDNIVVETPELVLPHPHLEEREFVLAPLRELRPELILPSGYAIQNVQGEGKVKNLGGLSKSTISLESYDIGE
ncbi:MAG TPA: 2-amino-4-hydroxy-6-hydroxymethyldihydropteridine diphosphokinase [Desulfitobacteriaceae bacterium]|nr:2-amino-4-hydroxy-6-hydroxymethyldihydropteridine diphosphokinase [Desulfitobacteriaceae bacterium]